MFRNILSPTPRNGWVNLYRECYFYTRLYRTYKTTTFVMFHHYFEVLWWTISYDQCCGIKYSTLYLEPDPQFGSGSALIWIWIEAFSHSYKISLEKTKNVLHFYFKTSLKINFPEIMAHVESSEFLLFLNLFDPDPQICWIRIQFGSRSTILLQIHFWIFVLSKIAMTPVKRIFWQKTVLCGFRLLRYFLTRKIVAVETDFTKIFNNLSQDVGACYYGLIKFWTMEI